ncbi:hypothetical protein [Nostoc sp.]|uniref:hypothetical protein n=1 Tax=Nostoc sp. TaxID=1180 RepID=UPI002FFAAAB0
MALKKAHRLVSPRSQPGGWECIQRGSASRQATGGGASLTSSQPIVWEPVRARAVSFISAILVKVADI